MKVCRICLCICTIFSLFFSCKNLNSTSDTQTSKEDQEYLRTILPDTCKLLNTLIWKCKFTRFTEKPAQALPEDPLTYKPSCFSENTNYFLMFSHTVNIINNIKQSNYLLNSALLYSSAAGFDCLVENLLQNGANINIQSTSSKTPLHLAVIGQHIKTTAILLAAGANPSNDIYALALQLNNKDLSKLFTEYLYNLDNVGAF